jgi:hypothetical protein
MGAIARQVLQVKRKNSINCNWPAAKVTVVGSVASRVGPREVGKILNSAVGDATGAVDVTTSLGIA